MGIMAGTVGAENGPQGTARSSAIKHLLVARALRDFGDGFVAVLLPVYLTALGLSPFQVGLVATAGPAWLRPVDAGHRHDRRQVSITGGCCSRLPCLMVATGVAFAVVHDLRRAAGRRICRHDQSFGRQRQRLRAAGACRADARRSRCRSHADVRALQPDRRAGRSRGCARCRSADLLAGFGMPAGAIKPCSCSTRCSASPAGCLYARFRPTAGARSRRRTSAALRPLAAHRLQARRSVQHRRVRRRLCRAVAAGALAVRAVRTVAGGGRPVLLLVGRACRLLLSGRGLAVAPHRPRQHDGVHAHPVEPVPDPGGRSRRA